MGESEVAALELDGDSSLSESEAEEDSFNYQIDALDDALYHDSEFDEQDDSDYVAEKDALELTYVVDAEDDVAESTEDEENEDDEKSSELGSDSEWSPDKSSFDYLSDYEAEHFYLSSSVSSSESESSVSDGSYNPDYDVQSYSSDYEEFVDSEEEDSDYLVEKDTFDYSQVHMVHEMVSHSATLASFFGTWRKTTASKVAARNLPVDQASVGM